MEIPKRLQEHHVTNIQTDYKVILIAHSMDGLVCRILIQNILQSSGSQLRSKYPDSILGDLLDKLLDLIHKLVTMGTPHKGIVAILIGYNFLVNLFPLDGLQDLWPVSTLLE